MNEGTRSGNCVCNEKIGRSYDRNRVLARERMGYSPDTPSVCSLFFAFLVSALGPRRLTSMVPSHRLPCPEERMEGRKGWVIYSHLPLPLPFPFKLAEVLSQLLAYCPLVTLLSQAHLPSGAALTGIR